MADFSTIIQEINDEITTNGVGAITGAKLNEVLRNMVSAVNDEKQDPLTIDATPTEDSTNPVQSGGVYDALQDKLDAPSTAGTSGQVLTSDGQGGQSWQTPTSAVSDVTVGGTSVVTNGVAAVPAIPTVPTISTDIASDATSDTKTTSPKAVKTFVENKGYGTYSKPSGGIPASDLASAVQTSLGKADTALQLYTESDPVFQASPAAGITASDISDWDDKAEPIPVVNVSTVPASMDADKLYDYGTLSADIIFPSLNTPSDATNAHVFWWTFKTGSTAPNVGWPASGITDWSGGSPPNIDASTTYEIMVSNGFASYIKST